MLFDFETFYHFYKKETSIYAFVNVVFSSFLFSFFSLSFFIIFSLSYWFLYVVSPGNVVHVIKNHRVNVALIRM